jgi:membrane-associated protein
MEERRGWPDVLEAILRFLEPAFRGELGYVIVATAVVLERSVLIGLVVPGEVTLATGAVYAARGQLDLVAVMAIGALAAMVGESVGFWLGRRHGASLLRLLPGSRRRRRVGEVERLLNRHGGKVVFASRFAAVVGDFVPFVAGTGRMPYGRFVTFEAPADVIWAVAVGLLGFLLGENVELLDRFLRNFGWAMLGVVVVGVGLYVRSPRRRWSSTASRWMGHWQCASMRERRGHETGRDVR